MTEEPQKKRRRRRRRGGRGKGGGQQSPVANQQPQQQHQPEPQQQPRDPQDVLGEAILKMLPSRDLEVLNWICAELGKPPGRIAFEMVKTSIVRERVAYRESKGGGGGTTRYVPE